MTEAPGRIGRSIADLLALALLLACPSSFRRRFGSAVRLVVGLCLIGLAILSQFNAFAVGLGAASLVLVAFAGAPTITAS